MKKLQCTDVYVKFKSNRNGQHLRFTDGHTSSFGLSVEDDSIRVTVGYLNKNGDATKIVVFPYADITEYSCEGIVVPFVPEGENEHN